MVTNSRPQKRLNQIWRRRRCLSCNSLFTTTEGADYYQSIRVIDEDGTLQPFVREKLFISLYNACGHRNDPSVDAQALSATVLGKLAKHMSESVLKRSIIIQTATEVLGNFDTAAASYYQAYHR